MVGIDGDFHPMEKNPKKKSPQQNKSKMILFLCGLSPKVLVDLVQVSRLTKRSKRSETWESKGIHVGVPSTLNLTHNLGGAVSQVATSY